jgi:rubrerythrin
VTDARTAAILQDVLRREGRSLLQYVSEAFPWATAEERAALAALQKLIDEERRAAAELGRFLTRRRVALPYLGAYPMEFTTTNYVSLDHLLPLLIGQQKKAVARLEQDLAALADADARTQLERLLTMKRQHLKELESLAAAHPEKVAVSQPRA